MMTSAQAVSGTRRAAFSPLSLWGAVLRAHPGDLAAPQHSRLRPGRMRAQGLAEVAGPWRSELGVTPKPALTPRGAVLPVKWGFPEGEPVWLLVLGEAVQGTPSPRASVSPLVRHKAHCVPHTCQRAFGGRLAGGRHGPGFGGGGARGGEETRGLT